MPVFLEPMRRSSAPAKDLGAPFGGTPALAQHSPEECLSGSSSRWKGKAPARPSRSLTLPIHSERVAERAP